MKIIGPFVQIVTMNHLPLKGKIKDTQLEIIENGGVLISSGLIKEIDDFENLKNKYPDALIEKIASNQVLLPGFIDSHTHICFAGSRAKDYAMRVSGKTYLEIAAAGGGIWDTVSHTRAASEALLSACTIDRANKMLQKGITTIEVKSGYGLSVFEELKMLRAINTANKHTPADLVATCLAAHIKPKDFAGGEEAYLQYVISDLLPQIKTESLAGRVDIFIEETAFTAPLALPFLKTAKQMGFACTVHADQFTSGGSKVAIAAGSHSADHLEASSDADIKRLAAADIVATVLPGASIGLGIAFAPARKLLDAGACVAIASDWNPGSAPMGDLLTQAAIMGAYEKLSFAETLSALTFRAAKALDLKDRGVLKQGFLADMQAYETTDFRDILYQQGALKPSIVWKKGESV